MVNETINVAAYQSPLTSLTTLQIVMISLAVIALSLVLGFWIYSYYKYGKHDKQRGTHPMLLMFAILLMGTAALWIPYLFGAIPEDRVIWLYVLTALLWTIIIYMVWNNWRVTQPLTMNQIAKEELIPYLSEKYQVLPYTGWGTYWPLVWMKRVTERVDGIEKVTDTFILTMQHSIAGVVRFLLQYDSMARTIIFEHPSPSESEVSKLLSLTPSEVTPDELRRYLERIEGANVQLERATGVEE